MDIRAFRMRFVPSHILNRLLSYLAAYSAVLTARRLKPFGLYSIRTAGIAEGTNFRW